MSIECPKCNGKGIVKIFPVKVKKDEPSYNFDICEFCHGEGKVDWVQRIVGKGSLTSEQKYDIWKELDRFAKWLPKKKKGKK